MQKRNITCFSATGNYAGWWAYERGKTTTTISQLVPYGKRNLHGEFLYNLAFHRDGSIFLGNGIWTITKLISRENITVRKTFSELQQEIKN